MKVLSIISFLILMSFFARAQNENTQNVHSVKVTFLGLSYAYEQSIARQSTVNFEFMVAAGFGSNFMNGDYWLIVPKMRIEPRYYYNYNRRNEKMKKTINNSANYLSLSADYQFGSGIGENATSIQTYSIIPKWGMKRTIGNHFIYEFAFGIGASTSEIERWKATIGLDLKLGYAF